MLLLAIALISSVFQFYLFPVYGVYPSLSLLSSLLLLPVLFKKRNNLFQGPVRFLIGLICVHAVSLLWSIDYRLGVRTILYLVLFVTIFFCSYNIARGKPEYIRKIIGWFLICSLSEAILVIVFRILPAFEDAFLKSQVARLFINPNTLARLFDLERNNVLEPVKSGGFFVNANFAAGFLGLCLFLTIGIFWQKNKKLSFVLMTLYIVSILHTGSKAGIILVVYLPFFAYCFLSYFREGFSLKTMIRYSCLLIVLTFIGFFALASVSASNASSLLSSDSLTATASALDTRTLIWLHGWQEFLIHPFAGQGFGGWQLSYPVYASGVGLLQGLPPHNTLIYLWSQSGLLALLLGIAFLVDVTLFGWRASKSLDPEKRIMAVSTLFAFFWVFIQGMGTNWGIVGDIHMQPVLAAALGLTYASCQSENENL